MGTDGETGTDVIVVSRRLRAETREARRALADARALLRRTRLQSIHVRNEVRRARRDRLGTVLCMAMPAPELGDDRADAYDGQRKAVAALRKKVADLEEALVSRDVIGQAKGILMERHGINSDAAFQWLRDVSQRRNEKVRVLAEELARTGKCP